MVAFLFRAFAVFAWFGSREGWVGLGARGGRRLGCANSRRSRFFGFSNYRVRFVDGVVRGSFRRALFSRGRA